MLNKILSFYTRNMAVWVVVFGIASYFFPGPFRSLRGFNEYFFSVTMFGIGVVLCAEDFKRIAGRPLIVVIGSVCQFTLMPVGAFLIAKIFHMPGELAVGLILTGSAPGAMASNVMSYVAGADTAYSVSLTTVSTLLCPILTPGLTLLLAGAALDVSFVVMFWSVCKMVVIPLMLGFGVRHFFGRHIERILPVFPAISVTFIVFVCSLVIALNRDYLAEVTGMILLAGVILNVYGMLGGYSVGRFFKMQIRQRRTLAIEIGMQNAGLGTVLALKHIGEKAAMPAAIFVFICIISASLVAGMWQRSDGRGGGAEQSAA